MARLVGLFKGKTVIGVFKQGWNEIPEIIATTALAVFGLGLGVVGLYNYYSKDGDNRRYKVDYIVYRPDDPRAAKVKNDGKGL
ncbi:uncharacterized protein LOC110833242 [Zootermopsis nevadensis]|uniref:Uncharacterized protein n=1 Tax=Zootermopsis nevadensis TaxID=136037 RepID=A0A067R1G1_ZOONE|nr:uncharacterized protein LOC110833242 [Zootermopsis nevadensis]KDR15806.1 hypothetical protein L798_10431 [Zootermopsis nevadensis]